MDIHSNDLTALEWKKMYLKLEGKMRNFRVRAVTIRSTLAVKMAQLSLQVEQAEEKAAFAEYQLSILRSANSNNTAVNEVDILRNKLSAMEKRFAEQRSQIVVLENQLEQETYLRKIEKQSLHDKAVKIKEWVWSVLQKAEKDQHELERSNARLKAAVKAMQERLTDVLESASGGTSPIHGHKIYDNTVVSTPFGKTDGLSSTTVAMELEQTNFRDSTTSRDQKNVYEVIEDECGVRDKFIEAKLDEKLPESLEVDASPIRSPSTKSSGDNDIEVLMGNKNDSRNELKFSTLPFPPVSFSNKSDSDSSNPGHTYYNIMGTLDSIRKKFKSRKDSHQKNKSPEDAPRGRPKTAKLKQKFSERNRSASKSKKMTIPSRKTSFSREKKADSQNIVQEKEDMLVEQFSSSFPSSHPGWKAPRPSVPPTPPLHRGFLTVESRIYEMAENGFKISGSHSARSYKAPAFKNDCVIGRYEEVVYNKRPFAIPVFARLDDNSICRIRNNPFSDASDSSAEDSDPSPAFTARRPSPRHHQLLTRTRTNSSDSLSKQQRRNRSPGVGRAIKRGNSQHSVTSSESDYAIPPDAHGSISLTPSDLFEPEHKLIKTSKHSSVPSASRTPALSSIKQLETDLAATKNGYLNKLSGKTRTWSKKYFVLRNETLYCYKSPNDVMKKSTHKIALSRNLKIERGKLDDVTFQITNDKRSYYLAAESSHSAQEWITALQALSTSPCGWLTRTIGGTDTKVWAAVRDGQIAFHEDDRDEMPFDCLKLNECKVEEAQLNFHVPVMSGHVRPTSPASDHVLLVRPMKLGSRDVYLSFNTNEQKSSWLQALTSSTSFTGGDARKSGTDFEKLVLKILQSQSLRGNTENDAVWRHPVLSHSKQGIAKPLTSLPSDPMKTEAMKIAKSVQLFTNEVLGSEAADYHVTIAQRIAQTCLTHSELRNEVYCQLIKETNRKKIEKNGEKDQAHLQCWKLLSLLIPIFLPQSEILRFLRKHLRRNQETRTTVGQYVIYCLRSLERALAFGERSTPPSRTECMSILFQNPYHHSLPISVPVHFSDGTYEVISFDCSTTVDEFSSQIIQQRVLRDHHSSGFALFVDNPDLSNSFVHHIDPLVKICDIISAWETVVRHDAVIYKTLGGSQDGAVDSTKLPKFIFKRRLYVSNSMKNDNFKESLLQLYQIANSMSRDQFPLNRDLAIEMTSLLLQLIYGDKAKNHVPNVDQTICRYYPVRYQGKNFLRQTRERIYSSWEALESMQVTDCVRVFLATAKKWKFCCSKFYQAQIVHENNKTDIVWLCVGGNSISVLQYLSLEELESYDFSQLVTFGGCKDQLLLVVSVRGKSKKVYFNMNQIDMMELVHTVSEYFLCGSRREKTSQKQGS